jgi:phosphate transport system substrate-binding protein
MFSFRAPSALSPLLAGLVVLSVLAVPGCDGVKTISAKKPPRKEYAAPVDPDTMPADAIVRIDGSSSLYPVTAAVAEEFQKAMRKTASVIIAAKGTSSGMGRFCKGEIDICNASRPIAAEELKRAATNGIEFIELPVCFDAVTVAVHPKNDWVDSITMSELKQIWEPAAQAKITKWNQIRKEWPDKELELFGPGSDSGTFDYFSEAVAGKAHASRGDYSPNEDDNVIVQGIEGNPYALGYLPFAFYDSNQTRLKALAVDAEKGKGPVIPSSETVLDGSYSPLSRPMFIYVNSKSAARPEVKAFVDFYLTNGAELAAEERCPPLPATAYKTCKERFEQRQTGSAFGGVAAVGVPIDELLKREPQPPTTTAAESK